MGKYQHLTLRLALTSILSASALGLFGWKTKRKPLWTTGFAVGV